MSKNKKMIIKIRGTDNCLCILRGHSQKDCPYCNGSGYETHAIEIVNWKEILAEILTQIIKRLKK